MSQQNLPVVGRRYTLTGLVILTAKLYPVCMYTSWRGKWFIFKRLIAWNNLQPRSQLHHKVQYSSGGKYNIIPEETAFQNSSSNCNRLLCRQSARAV